MQFNSTSDKEDDDMDKKMHQDGEDDGGLTEDDSGDMIPANGREVVMSVMIPRKMDDNGSTPVTEHQIIWVPASVPQPPPLYSIKQLNYAQVMFIQFNFHNSFLFNSKFKQILTVLNTLLGSCYLHTIGIFRQ